MSDQIIHKGLRETAFPRTGRMLDAVGYGISGGSKYSGSGNAGGGGSVVEADFDIINGDGISVDKSAINNLIYTISHADTSSALSSNNFDDSFIQNISVDDFGHVTNIESGRLAAFLDDRYLRKDIDDTAHGNILFDKKIGSSIFTEGWNGKGWEIQASGSAILNDLRVKSDLLVGNVAGSPTFASGFTGWGWQIDTPTATGEMDNLFIRKTFTAYEIVYSQIYGLGGSQIVSDINKIARVENLGDRYRCYMDDMDGLMLMNLRKGDGVRIQTRTGTTSVKYLFGRCLGVDSDYFDIALPLIEGGGEPQAGDFALRWGNNEDTDRQGLIYLTTADSGAPFIDVYDGITEASTEGKLKARLGHLTGIRTQRGDLLSGYGAYLNGIYVENSTFILQNGDTIEQNFIAMNGKFESLIEGIRNDISSEGGNILVNSSFSQNTNYWTVANNVHFINVDGAYLWVDGSFYVEKSQVADIYNDNGQNVLRIRNTYILQQNSVMNVPEHDVVEGVREKKKYSFSLFYKVLQAGQCGFGVPGTDLYYEASLTESESYQRYTLVADWDGTGNFELRFTGEILIYGVSLFVDEMAGAILKLQTQIDQTEEYIKLLATKEYVDSESGKIYLKYDGALEVTAEQISAINTKTDNINHTIETAGWITQADGVQLFAKKEMENGDSIVSAINVSPSTVKIQSTHLQLQGAVSFSMLSDYTTVNNRINNAADNANQALTDASSAWNKAVSAYSNADDAYTLANTAKTNAAKAIQDAANALSKAGSVQDALDDLPAWSKESSIIKALTSATVIVNGYIKTSMIDVDNLYCTSLAAVRGTVGGFTISGSTLTNGGTKLAGGVIEIGKESEDYYIHLGGVSASAGSGYALMLQNLMNSGYYGTNGASLYLKCGYPYYQNTLQRWIYAVDGQGTTKFELGVTHLTDPTNGISRIFIKAYQLAYKSQLVSTGLVSNPTWKALLYDTNTGYICWDY